MTRTGRVALGQDFGPEWTERFEGDFGRGRMDRLQPDTGRGGARPFWRGLGPHRGLWPDWGFGRGRRAPLGWGFGPLGTIVGLVHVGFLVLLVGLGLALFLCCCRRRATPVSKPREGASEPESERFQSNIE